MVRVAHRTAQLKTACGQNRIDPKQQHPNPTVAIVRARTSQRPRNHMHPLGCCRESTPMNRTDIVETNKNTPASKNKQVGVDGHVSLVSRRLVWGARNSGLLAVHMAGVNVARRAVCRSLYRRCRCHCHLSSLSSLCCSTYKSS